MAKLYFHYAAMNAGKSTLLLQAAHNYEEQGMRTLLMTSSLYADDENGAISSRLGVGADATLLDRNSDVMNIVKNELLEAKLDCIFIDEAQFLTKDQVWQCARIADHLGIPVMCYGLRTDFKGELFEGSAQLLAIADHLREIRTICWCGAKATMVVRKSAEGSTLAEGEQVDIEKSVYVSLCRKHWDEEMSRVL
ncbi:thymidine kinase [Hirschia maritima]|uniref:thymidine kinase n=1 Tax=Hirschia maritima TaxID=1121961 RepID=UPI00037D9A1D|nr:thymidine kinase [Hirschia maritima]